MSHAYPVTVVRTEGSSDRQPLQNTVGGQEKAHGSSKEKMLPLGVVIASAPKDHRCHNLQQWPGAALRDLPASPGLSHCDPQPVQKEDNTISCSDEESQSRESKSPR